MKKLIVKILKGCKAIKELYSVAKTILVLALLIMLEGIVKGITNIPFIGGLETVYLLKNIIIVVSKGYIIIISIKYIFLLINLWLKVRKEVVNSRAYKLIKRLISSRIKKDDGIILEAEKVEED